MKRSRTTNNIRDGMANARMNGAMSAAMVAATGGSTWNLAHADGVAGLGLYLATNLMGLE